MGKQVAAVAALLAGLLATGASCAGRSGPPAAGTELDCIADGRGGVRDCQIDYDWPNHRPTVTTVPQAVPTTPKPTIKTTTRKALR